MLAMAMMLFVPAKDFDRVYRSHEERCTEDVARSVLQPGANTDAATL